MSIIFLNILNKNGQNHLLSVTTVRQHRYDKDFTSLPFMYTIEQALEMLGLIDVRHESHLGPWYDLPPKKGERVFTESQLVTSYVESVNDDGTIRIWCPNDSDISGFTTKQYSRNIEGSLMVCP